MPFLQLTFELRDRGVETLESACLLAGALAVTLTDAGSSPILEPAPGETPLWSAVRLSALFDISRQTGEIIATLQSTTGRALPSHQFETVGDRVWEREWLKDFRPQRFGRRLWVCPHGKPPINPVEPPTNVWLDPGLAFGTGTHPTTAMCLEWLDTADLLERDVIDYGCGSGILAIAAVKLGARTAVGVDFDPQALLATRDNAERNGVAARVTPCAPEDCRDSADVLLANILAAPLIELAPRLAALVRPGGRLVLSGILDSQAESVTLACAPWFDMRTFDTRATWVCVNGERR